MGIVVQKYGGSSLADADAIKRVARRIVENKKAGHDVVVAVSAMGDTTDELLDLAGQVSRYREESECPGECPSFVAQHPEAFQEAYWEFRSIKVYQADNV